MPLPASFAIWADSAANTYHQFARLHALSEWWHWLLLLATCLAVVTYVAVLYRRDTVELRGGVAWSLLLLRLMAFGGILFFFLDLERRTEHKLVKNSRVLLLVDTSQSMGLQDQDPRGTATTSRIEQVTSALANGPLIMQLRAAHDVVAYRFDQQAKPVEIAAFPKLAATRKGEAAEAATTALHESIRSARWTALIAGMLLAVAAATGIGSWLANRQRKPRGSGDQTSYTLLVSMVSLIASLVVFAVATLRTPDLNVLVTLGLREPSATPADSRADRRGNREPEVEPQPVDWFAQLTPRGAETRIGDALEYLVNRERGGPVAGIVLFTDGGQNAGQQYQIAIAAARDAEIPIYTVGLGSNRRPQNVRVVDIEAPQRVYPGDRFTVTGLLQAFGMEGRTVKVELLSGAGGVNDKAPDTFEEERRVKLGTDGEVVPLKFEVTPSESGRRLYKVRVTLPEPDHDPRDNEKAATVQVVERKNRVLLLAGGPAHEFQFLRNLLFRDRETTVDVLLQSGAPGISQEAHEILFDFPKTADELFEYDCIVAFDPDWEALTDEQVRLLDRWVAEQAGGLIVLAGPVYTPNWSGRRIGDDRIDTIKGLYPVVFYHRGAATLSMGRFGGERPWPLQFTRDGLDAEFLWLAESATASEQIWSSFEGVYGYYAVKDPKPGARVYARFSDPDTTIDSELPIYMAGHFYGAGRVFFQASGEMWRVRAVDDSSFDQFYTKLIRWASQGRLLRDSSRGVLLVDKDRCLLGDHIAVRAILTDAQRRPLTDDEVPANILQPDGNRVPLKLRKVKEAARDGMYAAQFTAMQEGDYRVELRPPHSPDEELLLREVRARVPALEVEKPERNDALLTDIAEKTGGQYFIGIDAVVNRAGGGPSLTGQLESQDQETILPGKPDNRFQRLLMTWLMTLICGVLSVEWLIRRLSKLA